MPHFTLNVARRYEVAAPLQLSARIANARVIVRGGDQAFATVDVKLEIRARSREEAEDEADHVVRGIVFDGSKLSVESPEGAGGLWRGGIFRAEYEIGVPRQTSAKVGVRNGPLRVSEISGPVDARVTNGPASVARVAGRTTAHVVNGPLGIANCGGALDVSVVNGPLHVEKALGPMELQVTNGPVYVSDTELAMKASVLNGGIHYEGAVGGDFDLSARNGNVVLQVPSDSRFELDAEAEHGRVHSDLRVDEGAAAPEGAHRLRLRADRGSIHLSELRRAAPAFV